MTPAEIPDVAIIGAGVVGTAIARTLARYDLGIVVVDAANDVGTGTTKANTAILHTGFDAVPGSLESRLLRRGHALLAGYAAQAGIPVERTGALLIAWTPEQLHALLAEGKLAIAYIDRAVYGLTPAQRARHSLRAAKLHTVVPIRVSAASVTYHDPLPPGRIVRKSIRLFRAAYERIGSPCVVCSEPEGP